MARTREDEIVKSVIAGLIGGFLLFAGAPVDAQNLISNGSFETPLVPANNFTDFPVGSGAITSWTVFGPGGTEVSIVGGSFAQLGVTFPAQSGNQWLDLSGNDSTSTEGVSQTIATVPGRQYQLSYFIGNTTGGGVFGTTSTVVVLVNGIVAFTDTNAAISPTTLVWQQFTHTFVAPGTSTTLAFRSADPGGDNSNGLDNVVLIDQGAPPSDIPTLSQAGLIGTMVIIGLLAVALMRRRQALNKALDRHNHDKANR